jgi:hypothetical protein
MGARRGACRRRKAILNGQAGPAHRSAAALSRGERCSGPGLYVHVAGMEGLAAARAPQLGVGQLTAIPVPQ